MVAMKHVHLGYTVLELSTEPFSPSAICSNDCTSQVQRLGGRWDGFWYTESLTADGIEMVTLSCI